MDTKILALVIGGIFLLLAAIRIVFIYKKKSTSPISTQFTFWVLAMTFVLLFIAGLISFYFHFDIEYLLIGLFLFLFAALIVFIIAFWIYLLLKKRYS